MSDKINYQDLPAATMDDLSKQADILISYFNELSEKQENARIMYEDLKNKILTNLSANNITSGILLPAQGGTGNTSLQATRNAMGLGNTLGTLPVSNGGTGRTDGYSQGIVSGAVAGGGYIGYTLPAGGTWRYIEVRWTGDNSITTAEVGTVAGGTTIGGVPLFNKVFAIRVA